MKLKNIGIILALLAVSTFSFADTAIWSLTDGTTANATDRIPIARSAVANNYITPLEIATYVGTTYGTGVATALGTAANASGGVALQNGAITSGNLLKGSATGVQDTGIAASSLKSFAINTGTTRTMASNQEIFVCTTTCTFTPEASPTAGDQFCIQNGDNVATVITIAATAGIQYETTARTSYKTANTAIASSGAVKDQICYVAISATQWNVFSATGTWN